MTVASKSSLRIVVLVVCFVGLVVAFVLLPAVVSGAASPSAAHRWRLPAALPAAAASNVVDYWRGGAASYPADLQQLIDYWRVWHATKIAITSLMLVVLVLLAVVLWRRYLSADRRPSVVAWAAGMSSVFVILASLALAANIQTTAAPSISLLLMLSESLSDYDIREAVDAMTVGLTDGASVESRSPALHTLMSDAQAYHWTFAAVMLVLGVVGCVVAGACVRRRRGSAAGSRVRVMSTTVLAIACVAAALYLGLAVYTVTLALHPADALVNVLGTE